MLKTTRNGTSPAILLTHPVFLPTTDKQLMKTLYLVLLAFALSPQAAQAQAKKNKAISYDYATMFQFSRQLLTREPVRKFLREEFADMLTISAEDQKKFGYPDKIKDMSESQLILLLQNNPDVWPDIADYLKKVPDIKEQDAAQVAIRKKFITEFKKLLADKDIAEKFKKYNDPTEPVTLSAGNGSVGYSNPHMYVDHAREYEDGTKKPADDLRQVWIDFFTGAEKESAHNVFESDMKVVANAIVEASEKKGIKYLMGGHRKSFLTNPDIQAWVAVLVGEENVKKLLGKELTVTQGNRTYHSVESPALDHQKVAVNDWSVKGKGRTLFSSGNGTQSCTGPEGDLVNVPAAERPPFSLPNANHMITFDSDIQAQIVHNELVKTLDPNFQLTGNEFPLTGVYRVYGDTHEDPKTSPYTDITFTPRGAIGDVNVDIIGKTIRENCGAPIRMLQFAFSSKEVEEALFACAEQEIKAGHKFDFKSVGDVTFAERDFSIFLNMSCLTLSKDGKLSDTQDCRWKKLLGAQYQEFQDNIRSGPDIYGTHHYTDAQGKDIEVTSKIHHKMLKIGEAAIIGTSFNFSANAEKNNEQILVSVRDAYLLKESDAMFTGMFNMTTRSVAKVAHQKASNNKAEKANCVVKLKGNKPKPKKKDDVT